MTDQDTAVIDYLKKQGIYGTFALAAGVNKDAGVGDVHAPTALGNEEEKPDDKKAKPISTIADPAPAAEVAKRADIWKRLTAADVVFAKLSASLYVARWLKPESAHRLHEWAESQGIKNVVPEELMHVTVAHSSVAVPDMQPLQDMLDIGPGRWLSTLGKDGKAIVMMFASPELQERFKQFKAAGATWDFPSYMPHITLSYDGGADAGDIWGMVQAPDFPLLLGPETFGEDNSSWVDDNGLVEKSAGEFELEWTVSKADADKQLLFGWASVASVNGVEVIDKQGDIIPIEELEKAAYDFTLYSRQHGNMHERVGTGRLVESMMFTPEKAALGIVAKNAKGETVQGWWVGFHVDDPEVWKMAKAGHLPEFSIGGKATPVEVG